LAPQPIGDVDGDGIEDIALSYRPRSGWASAQIHVLFMNLEGGVRDSSIIIPYQIPGLNLDSREAFGSAISSVGDLNHDGTPDLVVGSPSSSFRSNVYVMLMNPDGTVQDWSRIGGNAFGFGTGFGSSIASLGDLNADGATDLLVGAPLGTTGVAHVLFLGRDGLLKYHQTLSNNSSLS
jgi:hypothetical protein